VINLLTFLFLTAALLMLAGKGTKNSITLLALQSLSLSLLAFYLAFSGDIINWHMLIVGILTLLIKVITLPWVFFRLVARVNIGREVPVALGLVSSVIVGFLVVGIIYSYVVPDLMLKGVKGDGHLLPVALSSILLGCFYMVSRCSILSQLIGIVVIENGLFLSALALTGGMPLFIELGIFFDVLVGALVMGAITYRISDRFQSLDTNRLTRLKG